MQINMSYLTLAALWLLWCVLHSGMIAMGVTDFLKRRVGKSFRFYRLFFNLTAIATIIPVILYARALHAPLLLRWEGFMIVNKIFLLVIGVALFLAGAKHYDMLQFLGIRQIKTGAAHGALSASGGLQASGILKITRHPWYLGAMMLLWTGDLTAATLIGNVILTLYLIVGTLLEERKLVLEFGEDYRRYQKQVSMLIPFKHWRHNLEATR